MKVLFDGFLFSSGNLQMIIINYYDKCLFKKDKNYEYLCFMGLNYLPVAFYVAKLYFAINGFLKLVVKRYVIPTLYYKEP